MELLRTIFRGLGSDKLLVQDMDAGVSCSVS